MGGETLLIFEKELLQSYNSINHLLPKSQAISKRVFLYPRRENGYDGQTLNFLLNFLEIVKNPAVKRLYIKTN